MFSGDGFSEESFGVSEHVVGDDTAFQAFLARIRAPRCWLLEIDAFSLAVADAEGGGFSESGFGEVGFSDAASGAAASVQTLRYSTHGWTMRDYGVAEHLYLPGTAGNFASTPDSAAVSVTGDIEASGKFAPTNAAAVNGLLYKAQTIDVRLRADGKLQAYFSLDGSAIITAVSSVTAAFANAAAKYWKVTRASVSGDVVFSTSTDGITFSQLGTTQATTAGALYNSTAELSVGRSGGSALKFGGKTHPNYVSAAPAAVNGLTAVSLEFWVRLDSFGGSYSTPIGIGPGDTNGSWRVDIAQNGAISGNYWLDGNAESLVGVIVLGVTYHVVSTFSGTFKRVYVDGVEVARNAGGATAVASSQVIIGRGYFSFGVDGAVSGVRIYNRALSAAEVLEHYAGTYSDESGLIANWDFDDGSGLIAIDSSGTAAHGSLIASSTYPTWVAPLAISNYGNGKIYTAEIRNGIDGPIVARFNPALDARPGDTSFTSSTTGEVWTINQSGADPAQLVAGGEVGLYYDGRIKDGFTVNRDIAGRDGVGGLTRVYAELALSNADGGLDGLTNDYAIDGRAVRLLVGAEDAAYAEFGTVFTGVVESVSAPQQAVRLRLSDGMAKLDVPMQPVKYLGTGGLEGGADLKGKPKPLCYGARYNVSPVLVDAANLLWQVNNGPIQDVPALRDRGVALTRVLGTPSPGQYQPILATGFVKLGATPAGEVTCDVQGDAPTAGYTARLATIAQRILADKLYTSDIDTTAFANLNSVVEAPTGIWIGAEERTAADVLDEFLFGAGCFGGFSRHGVFSVGRIAAQNDAPVLALDAMNITTIEREPLPAPLDPAVWSVALGWRRNHTVQTDIAALASNADRAFALEEWRVSRSADAAIKSRHILAREYGPIPSPFTEQADGDAEAARLFALWGAPRARFRVGTVIEGMLADVGQVVILTHQRHRLQNGAAARVVGQTITGSKVELRVIT